MPSSLPGTELPICTSSRPQAALPHWLAVVTAMGIATVIADEGFERLGICRAADCRDACADTSRNRSRRHRSDSCRTRGNVAAYRERQRSKA